SGRFVSRRHFFPAAVAAAGPVSVPGDGRAGRPGRVPMASKNLYVGNLPFTTTSADLEQLFGQYGTVTKAQVINDRETGRSRGFGFVEMSDGAEAAVEAVNGADFQGRRLTVNEAKPREARPRGGGYGGAGGGRGGGGGYGGGRGGYGDRY